MTFAAIIEKGDFGKRGSGWFSGVEKGKSRMTLEEFDQIAQICDVAPSILLTGYGLDPAKMVSSSNRSRKNASDTIVLPSVSEESKREWFKSRVLRKGVKMAAGLEMSELFELAMDADNFDIDWEAVWFEKTAEGAKIQAYINKVTKNMTEWGNVLSASVMIQIAETIFPKDED